MIKEFTCTSIIRPSILRASLESMKTHLKGVNLNQATLYINIDKSPLESDPSEMIKVAQQYFEKVVANCPEQPNFSKALHWCFQQPIGQYFFHMQQDWTFTKDVEIGNLIGLLNTHKNKFAVNIRAYAFQIPKLCLAHCLFRNSFAKSMTKHWDFSINPERQLRDKISKCPYPIPQCIHYPIEPIDDIRIVDIGRQWLIKKKLKRNHHGKKFIKHQQGGNGFSHI